MTLAENMEMALSAARYEQSIGYVCGLTLALGKKGWVAKFLWNGKTLRASAGTAEEAMEQLVTLIAGRRVPDSLVG